MPPDTLQNTQTRGVVIDPDGYARCRLSSFDLGQPVPGMAHFDRFVERELTRLKTLAIARLKRHRVSDEDAMDIYQTACLRAWRGRKTWRGGCPFEAWFWRVLHFTHMDTVRSSRRRPELLLDDVFGPDEEGGTRQYDPEARERADIILRHTLPEAVAQALRTMPDYQRRLLLMHEIEGVTYEALAEMEGVPIGTIKSRINRAKRHVLSKCEGIDPAELAVQ